MTKDPEQLDATSCAGSFTSFRMAMREAVFAFLVVKDDLF